MIAALRRMPEVGRIHSTNGRWDLIAELDTPDLAALDRALIAIRALKPVARIPRPASSRPSSASITPARPPPAHRKPAVLRADSVRPRLAS